MTENFKALVPTIALIAVLAVSPVAPEAGNILFLACGSIGLILAAPAIFRQIRRPIVWMTLLGLALVATAYLASSGLAGLSGILFFAPVLAIAPLLLLIDTEDKKGLARLLSILALCGVAGAAALALSDFTATGTSRAGGIVANPIHFADVALLIGFVALVGLGGHRSNWRFVLFAAPLFAAVAVVLSGTRGAVVAYAAMVAAAAMAIVVLRLVAGRTVLLGSIGLAAVTVVAVALGAGQLSGIERVMSDFTNTVIGGGAVDQSTNLRLLMYQGGFRAFMQSPLFGYGPETFTAIADSLADTSFGGAPHLHNDLVDMAASAGLMGVAAYFLFVFAPIMEILSAPRSKDRDWLLVLATTLITGFIVMGLTNAMFGILNVTTVFAATCVAIAALVKAGPFPSGHVGDVAA